MRLLCSILLMVALVTPAAAQYPPEVAVGTRVRLVVGDTLRQALFMPREHAFLGTVAAIGGDTLYVTVLNMNGTLWVLRNNVRALSISRGVPSRVESALREGLIAAAAIAAWAWAAHNMDDNSEFDSSGQAALAGAGFGFAIGAVTGAMRRSERWRRVRLRD